MDRREKHHLLVPPRGGSTRTAIAAELVRLNVDIIVAVGTLGPLAAKAATSGQSLCDGCPQLVEADIRAFGRHSGFAPIRSCAVLNWCSAN
jgi:hypothetical protein